MGEGSLGEQLDTGQNGGAGVWVVHQLGEGEVVEDGQEGAGEHWGTDRLPYPFPGERGVRGITLE